ncbi:MAG: hypothetical protein MZV70_66085 [Desulfobacterales bacterium]|nr:hypothetical protein [Desulfobacterales bacterium]
MAVGRLAGAHGPREAVVVVNKITGYERASGMKGAVFVADTTEGFDFLEAAARQIETLLPFSTPVHEVFRGRFPSDEAARNGSPRQHRPGTCSDDLYRAWLGGALERQHPEFRRCGRSDQRGASARCGEP